MSANFVADARWEGTRQPGACGVSLLSARSLVSARSASSSEVTALSPSSRACSTPLCASCRESLCVTSTFASVTSSFSSLAPSFSPTFSGFSGFSSLWRVVCAPGSTDGAPDGLFCAYTGKGSERGSREGDALAREEDEEDEEEGAERGEVPEEDLLHCA